jgi:DNA-binding response OmpR family regulator
MELVRVSKSLEGLCVLVLEDEFLIAMDVEQLCREYGAKEVAIMQSLDELEPTSAFAFDVAVLDMALRGASTLDFAKRLQDEGVPFVFATGYDDVDAIALQFPEVAVVRKPYAVDELIRAIAAAARRARQPDRPPLA